MKESEPRYEDADVEITDLDADRADEHSAVHKPLPAGGVSQSQVWARRHKRPLTAASVALVALVFLLVVASSSTIRGLAGGLLARHNPTPAPAPTLLPGGDLFYVDAAPPWGHLWIDGRAIARLPAQGVDAPLHISRGRHTLMWRAAPFDDQQCALTVPSNYASDTCVVNEYAYTYAPDGLSVSSISFDETLNNLPPNASAALVSTAQAALDAKRSMDLVRRGELYALSPDNPACKPGPIEPPCYAMAAQPLQARLSYRLATNPKSDENCLDPEPNCSFQYQTCYAFCTGGFTLTAEWNVFVPVLPLWTFTTLSGAVVERDIPDNSLADFATGEMTDELLIPLLISWDGAAWHVLVPAATNTQQLGILDNPACAAAASTIQSFDPPADASGQPIDLQWQFASDINPAGGCVGVGSPSSVQSPVTAPGTMLTAYALYRFGVILAANGAAHQFWPQLPLADGYERQLARQLLSPPGSPQP